MPWKIRDPENRRKIIDWVDTIPKNSIILFAFELTQKGHLRKCTVAKLQEEYSTLKEKVSGIEE